MVARAPKSGHRPGVETTCPHCPSTFPSELLCIQHVKTTHPGLKPFACPHGCTKTFTGKQQMLKHAANDVCGLKDMPASALNTPPPRKRKHQRNTSFGSSPTRYREKKPLVYAAPGTQGNEASCAHCPDDDPDNVFRSEMMMVLHVKAVHGRDVKPFPCLAGCGKFFTLKRTSTSHSVRCPGAWKTVPAYDGQGGKIKFERSGSSASAGSDSSKESNAVVPTHSHRGMARTGIDGFPEECDRCGMEFSRRSNLLRHQKQGACKGVWKANKPVENRVDMALIDWAKKGKEEVEEAEKEAKEEKKAEEEMEVLLLEAFAEEEEEESEEE